LETKFYDNKKKKKPQSHREMIKTFSKILSSFPERSMAKTHYGSGESGAGGKNG
jgi:hypothetical protein